jgi:hypothetical protein
MLLNLFQVRLRAIDVPEGHLAEGTVRAEPEEVHPGDEMEVIVDVRFAEGDPPANISVRASPPEDMTAGEARVELGHDGATITIPATVEEEVELGTYYLQVVYSDDEREHFEAEAPLEVRRHWVRIGEITSNPARASPGDPVEVSVEMGLEGQSRVRGHVRGRLVPEEWDGSEENVIKLPRERSSVAESREHIWHVRVPKSAQETRYSADVEFSSQERTARRRARGILHLVPQRGIEATDPLVEPALVAPGEAVTVQVSVQNVGLEPLDMRVAGELNPEVGGASVALEDRTVSLGPGETHGLSWDITSPDRHGRWAVSIRARAERTEGSDPKPVILDVRPPHQVHMVGVVPSRPWASRGERVDVTLQLMDMGSDPGHDAVVHVALEGESGESSVATWRGWVGREEIEGMVDLTIPELTAQEVDGDEKGSGRFALVVRGADEQELLRVPGAVAIRRRVDLDPHVIKAKPDPMRIGDCLLPGERVVRTVDSGETTLIELSSGCRMYARGDAVAGVDEDQPMDQAFWSDAVDADLRLYTDIKAGLQQGAKVARAEAMVMATMARDLAREGSQSEGLVKETRRLVASFDPDHQVRRVEPRKGPLAPLASWLSDPEAPAIHGRDLVSELRRYLTARTQHGRGEADAKEARSMAGAAAGAAADHLDRLAELLDRAWEQDRFDSRTLKATTSLVAASGVALVELHRLRQTTDPWSTPAQLVDAQKITIQATVAQLASLVELVARHRNRKAASVRNTRQRAAHAAVARDLEIDIPSVVGHSGDAAGIEVILRNGAHIDLDLRLNVALPSVAWTILEPQARGAKGLMFVGPIHVPARSEERVRLILYVPTTVRLDSYTVPIEVVPEPKDITPEQGGVDL